MAILSVVPNPRITFKVRHEDGDVLVVDKPAGLVTQPGLGHEDDTLLNGLFAVHGARLQNLGKSRDYGLLHRLDKEASGLLLVALSGRAYDALRRDFEDRRIGKYYYAVAAKAPSSAAGLIEKPIAESIPRSREKKLARIVSSVSDRTGGGKDAATAYRVVASSDLGCLIEARPLTGRLHQVRVHLKFIGCPLLGDDLYAPRAVAGASGRVALHAHRLVFDHPVTGLRVDVRSPLPRDFKSLLGKLRLESPPVGETSRN